jgi:hypothetical protein
MAVSHLVRNRCTLKHEITARAHRCQGNFSQIHESFLAVMALDAMGQPRISVIMLRLKQLLIGGELQGCAGYTAVSSRLLQPFRIDVLWIAFRLYKNAQ